MLVITESFRFNPKKINTTENLIVAVAFSEHIEELRQRIYQSLIISFLVMILFFTDVNSWVEILTNSVKMIKFIQLAPGEYFISTLKISIYAGLLFSLPIIITQTTLFILPGLSESEKNFILPLLILSSILFISGIIFSYKILIPAALIFFVKYGSGFVEPLWSFDEYLNFVTSLFFTTGITFQIPLVQIILGLTNVSSSSQMLKIWKYIIVGATIVGAILTPSTDPITQLCLSFAIIFLYFIGILILKLYKK
jgi:sec-independent protein translocase protein TatC